MPYRATLAALTTTAVGIKALTNNTTVVANTSIGTVAFQFNTTGSDNIAVGGLDNNTIGSLNVAIRVAALARVPAGS